MALGLDQNLSRPSFCACCGGKRLERVLPRGYTCQDCGWSIKFYEYARRLLKRPPPDRWLTERLGTICWSYAPITLKPV